MARQHTSLVLGLSQQVSTSFPCPEARGKGTHRRSTHHASRRLHSHNLGGIHIGRIVRGDGGEIGLVDANAVLVVLGATLDVFLVSRTSENGSNGPIFGQKKLGLGRLTNDGSRNAAHPYLSELTNNSAPQALQPLLPFRQSNDSDYQATRRIIDLILNLSVFLPLSTTVPSPLSTKLRNRQHVRRRSRNQALQVRHR